MPVQDELLLTLREIGAGDLADSLGGLAKDLDALSKSEKELVKNTDKIAKSFGSLRMAGRGLAELGRGFEALGGLFNNDALRKLGDYSRGVGEITRGFSDLKNVAQELSRGGLLSKLTLGAGAAVGGAFIGSQIYDATIGKLQGTDTATILDQMRQIIEAGFNADTLKMNVQNAAIQANILAAGGDVLSKLAQQTADKRAAENKARYALPFSLLPASEQVKSPLTQHMQQYQQEQAKLKLSGMAGVGTTINTLGQLEAQIQALNTKREGNAIAHGMKMASIERDAQQQRLQVSQQYASDLAAIEKQYYAQRSRVAAQFGQETARMEEDHQRDIRRLQQDHSLRLRKLAESRDALGMSDEMESYKIERDRAEEDYQVQAQRRNEDFALQLADMEQAFRDQRDARTQQYQQQLQQINQQAQDRRNVETQNWQALLQTIVLQTTAAIAQLNKEFAKLQTPSSGSSPDTASHAWGGYQTRTGTAYMHAGEFVLNAQTARAMEAITGQRLSQSSVINSTGGTTINLSMPMTISGAQAEPEVYRAIVHTEIVNLFNAASR